MNNPMVSIASAKPGRAWIPPQYDPFRHQDKLDPLALSSPQELRSPPAMQFPGRTLRHGFEDPAPVRALQAALNRLGCGPVAEDGAFGDDTVEAVRLFQARFPAPDGGALAVDGLVGPLTWAALFGAAFQPAAPAPGPLARAALEEARSQLGVLERGGPNAGPEVEGYLAGVGLGRGQPWCAAFVHWCVGRAAARLGRPNPLPRTGHVLTLWREARRAGLAHLLTADALDDPSRLAAGAVFILRSSDTQGHTGFVQGWRGGRLLTLEGNSNKGGSREGIGVFELDRRSLASITEGFLLLD
jgi:hypothetical protein